MRYSGGILYWPRVLGASAIGGGPLKTDDTRYHTGTSDYQSCQLYQNVGGVMREGREREKTLKKHYGKVKETKLISDEGTSDA